VIGCGGVNCFDRIRLLIDRRRLGLQYRPVAFGRRIGRAEGARGCGCWRHQHGANDRRYARSCRAWRHLCSAHRSEPRRSATDRGGTPPGVCRRRDQRNSWCAGGLALDPQRCPSSRRVSPAHRGSFRPCTKWGQSCAVTRYCPTRPYSWLVCGCSTFLVTHIARVDAVIE